MPFYEDQLKKKNCLWILDCFRAVAEFIQYAIFEQCRLFCIPHNALRVFSAWMFKINILKIEESVVERNILKMCDIRIFTIITKIVFSKVIKEWNVSWNEIWIQIKKTVYVAWLYRESQVINFIIHVRITTAITTLTRV